MQYDCFSGCKKKGPKTTPIVLSLMTIESRKSALILKIILLSIVIFCKCRRLKMSNFFSYRLNSAKKRISHEIPKFTMGTVARKKTVG